MNKQGFTLTEVLTVVIIIGVLTSVAMPMYMRSVERARATEAMNAIKALNDSIYAYFADKDTCPTKMGQLVAALPQQGSVSGCTAGDKVVCTNYFQIELDNSAASIVPGTDCHGILATRKGGGGYSYKIWNPYTHGSTGKALALQCAPLDESNEKSKAVCESLGLYREPVAE